MFYHILLLKKLFTGLETKICALYTKICLVAQIQRLCIVRCLGLRPARIISNTTGRFNDILVTFEISKFPQRPFYFWC